MGSSRAFIVIGLFLGLIIDALAYAAPATYLGTFEVRQVQISSKNSPTKVLCNADGTAAVSSDDESRAEDCGKKVHAYKKDHAVILIHEDETFLSYANPFQHQFCKSWVSDTQASGEALFASDLCRSYLTDQGFYYFSSEKDPLDYMINSDIITMSVIGVPLAMRTHQEVTLVGSDANQPDGIHVLDRVDGTIFFISTGINYDYSLKRL